MYVIWALVAVVLYYRNLFRITFYQWQKCIFFLHLPQFVFALVKLCYLVFSIYIQVCAIDIYFGEWIKFTLSLIWIPSQAGPECHGTVYPKKYAHGFCFAVLCCGYTLTDFPISSSLTSLALWKSNDCPSAGKATLMNMDKYFMWNHYERLRHYNKAKHKKTVCIFLGIYCILPWLLKSPSHRQMWYQSARKTLMGMSRNNSHARF